VKLVVDQLLPTIFHRQFAILPFRNLSQKIAADRAAEVSPIAGSA
jgi:hypothetical protein